MQRHHRQGRTDGTGGTGGGQRDRADASPPGSRCFAGSAPRILAFGDEPSHESAPGPGGARCAGAESGQFRVGWQVPRLPGLGEVRWDRFFGALHGIGYRGPVIIEHEDRNFEGSEEAVIRGFHLARDVLRPYVV